MNTKNWNMNAALALVIIILAFAIVGYIVVAGAGGSEALFLIIGNISGWCGSVVLYYFRKKPSEKEGDAPAAGK